MSATAPQQMISAARTQLVLRRPFFGTLALHMPVVESVSIPTAATDGRSLLYNPAFVEWIVKQHQLAGLQTIIAHEVMHAALHHCFRRGSRKPILWNVATDLAVNDLLRQSGFSILPGMLYDRRFADMSAEAVYDLLQKDPGCRVSVLQSAGSSSDNSGDHSLWGNSQSAADLEAQWKTALSRAVQAQKMSSGHGSLPGVLERLIEDILYPRLDWRQVLASFLQPVKADYSFLSPDRRFDDIFLPDFNVDSVEEVVVAIDTSGSTYKCVSAFLAEVRGILASFPQVSGYLVQCDAQIQDWQPLDEYELRSAKLKGFGGTDFRPVFEEIDKRGIDPTALVYLTDGYGYYPAHQPHYPVLWVLTCEPTDGYHPPFGQVIQLNLG